MRIFEENLGCEYELSPMQSIYAIFITFFSPRHFTFSHSPPHSSFSFYLLFYGFFCLYKRVFWKCKYFWKNLILFLYDVNKTFRSPYLAEIVLIREPCQKYQSWLYKLFFFGIWSQYVRRNLFFVLSSGYRRLKPTGDQVESWNHPWVSKHHRFISMLHNEKC